MQILCEEEILRMVSLAKLGDEEGLCELVQYYTPYIKSKSFKHNINGFDFDDLFSEGVRTLLKCVESYKSERAAFTPYFFRALSNEINLLLRKSYKDEALGKRLYSESERVCETLDLEENIYKEELKEEIAVFIRGLNGDEREVIDNIYFKGNTMAETARKLKYPFYKVQHIRNLVLRRMKNSMVEVI